jgi:hypothetical protein
VTGAIPPFPIGEAGFAVAADAGIYTWFAKSIEPFPGKLDHRRLFFTRCSLDRRDPHLARASSRNYR